PRSMAISPSSSSSSPTAPTATSSPTMAAHPPRWPARRTTPKSSNACTARSILRIERSGVADVTVYELSCCFEHHRDCGKGAPPAVDDRPVPQATRLGWTFFPLDHECASLERHRLGPPACRSRSAPHDSGRRLRWRPNDSQARGDGDRRESVRDRLLGGAASRGG